MRAAETPTAIQLLVDRCRAAGLRRTYLLEAVLRALDGAEGPLSINALLAHPDIQGHCDPATLYRLLSRLEDKGLARRVGLHERAAHFVLHHPECHHDLLICVKCGKVQALPMECPVEQLEAEVAHRTGFTKLYHELQYYGQCPDCASR
ncbi:MAG: Fur family transcriptional regulator [Opitutales bacterium]